MKGVNKIMVLGNVGHDPETRTFGSGSTVTTLSIATTDSWKDKNSGQKVEETEWHDCKFFGKLSEIVAEYVRKGSKIYIEGSMKTEKWTDKTSGEEKSRKFINCTIMQMIDSPRDSQPQRKEQSARQPTQRQAQTNTFDDDLDLPFN